MTAYLQAGAFVILALLLGYAVHYAGRLYGRDEAAAAKAKRAAATASSGYAMAFPCYFSRPLDGEMTADVGLYITGSSDEAIADRLVRASREVMR